jgi:chorismate mutase
MYTTIQDERQKVDELDRQIIELLSKRFDIVRIIGNLKKESGIPALDQNRWEEILETRKAWAQKLDINVKMVEEIYEVIHKYALEEENRSLKQEARSS